jgi:hypothetical protein
MARMSLSVWMNVFVLFVMFFVFLFVFECLFCTHQLNGPLIGAVASVRRFEHHRRGTRAEVRTIGGRVLTW